MLAFNGATYITDFFILFEAASYTAENIIIYNHAGRILQCRNPVYRWSLGYSVFDVF